MNTAITKRSPLGLARWAESITGAIGEPWLPVVCAGCAEPGLIVCDSCRRELIAVTDVAPPAQCDVAVAVFEYSGVGKRLISALKYRHRRRLARWFAECLVMRHLGALSTTGPANSVRGFVGEAPTLVAMPASHRQRHRRGYDQARLVVDALSELTKLPVITALRRTDRVSQTGRSRRERMHSGPRLEWCSRDRAPRLVILIDDVITTGASMTAAAELLKRHGANQVTAASVAWTPKGAHHHAHHDR